VQVTQQFLCKDGGGILKEAQIELIVQKVMEQLQQKFQAEQKVEQELPIGDPEKELIFSEQDWQTSIPSPVYQEGMSDLVESTPARIGVWRTGTRPLTKTMLKLQFDHAAAIDAVGGEVLEKTLAEFDLFTIETCYENKEMYLKRPDKGRVLTKAAVQTISERCRKRPQVQIVVSDGLSASAIETNLKDVYPALLDSLKINNLTCGTSFFVKGGRVACMDHIGEILEPEVLVLLIGERPGLVSASSLSAYMCYSPRKGMIESERTVISNIQPFGTPPIEAGAHIGTVLKKMLEQKVSGVKLEL
jgi:ethanolamine ammonia-lyase small subunit